MTGPTQELVPKRGTVAGILYRQLLRKIEGEDLPCFQDPEMWWSTDPYEMMYAQTVCRQCPAVDLCAQYAVEAHEREGIWGGLTPSDRSYIRQRQQRIERARRDRERNRAQKSQNHKGEKQEHEPANQD